MPYGTFGGDGAEAGSKNGRWWRALKIVGAVVAVEGLFVFGLVSAKRGAASPLSALFTPSRSACAARAAVTGEARVERTGEAHRPAQWTSLGPATDMCHEHEVIIAASHVDVGELDAALMDVSTPGSANYRSYWDDARLTAWLGNDIKVAKIEAWLGDVGAHVVRSTRRGD